MRIERILYNRLAKLAKHKCLSVEQLAHLYLEASVNYEERMIAETNTITTILEDILTRAILRGEGEANGKTEGEKADPDVLRGVQR